MPSDARSAAARRRADEPILDAAVLFFSLSVLPENRMRKHH